jgi:predicted O-methyltransferase YrrM
MPGRGKAEERRRFGPVELAGADELIARFAAPEVFAARQAVNKVALGPEYIEYVFAVSAPEHAVSLPLASFLLTACQTVEPASAADLGSGFSSFVLRTFAAGRNSTIRVVSADDDAAWLAKTAAFLSSSGLSADNLVPWGDFAAAEELFELVLYDLGHWQRRFEALPQAVASVAPGGLLILDDLHIRPYREAVEHVLDSAGLRAHDLTPYTGDEYGRFSWAVVT